MVSKDKFLAGAGKEQVEESCGRNCHSYHCCRVINVVVVDFNKTMTTV
jgi:hypothetical protein